MSIINEVTNRKSKVDKINLETMIESYIKEDGTDIYIGKPDKFVVNFPCKPTREFNYGDKVYLIGNPRLRGTNIRKGYISDLDGYGDVLGKAEYTFGIDFPVQGGDSGCPVVNDKFELLGLVKYHVDNKFGYISKIGLYLDEIEKLKGVVTKPINESNRQNK